MMHFTTRRRFYSFQGHDIISTIQCDGYCLKEEDIKQSKSNIFDSTVQSLVILKTISMQLRVNGELEHLLLKCCEATYPK